MVNPHSPLKMSSRTSDMDDFHKGLCGWSWKENKLFELALAVVDENHLKRWACVSSACGGKLELEREWGLSHFQGVIGLFFVAMVV